MIVTGGHGDEPVDTLFDGERIVEIAVPRHDVAATHGAGCTHSATLAALWRGDWSSRKPRGAGRVASGRSSTGYAEIGAGDGPCHVVRLRRE